MNSDVFNEFQEYLPDPSCPDSFISNGSPSPDPPALSGRAAVGPADSAGPSSVHTEETTEPAAYRHSYRNFLTSGSLPQIMHGASVYGAIDVRDGKNRLVEYSTCRAFAWFIRHRVSGHIKVASKRCSLRWCPLCIRTKRYIITQSVKSWLLSVKRPKFLTLTLKHTTAPLADQINNLYRFWSTLRRRPKFRKRVFGGVWFFQVKRSKNDGNWHPHIHVLLDSLYVPHSQLVSMWEEITHGSKIVDIRPVKDGKKAVDYVARYASAPCRLSDFSLDDSIEIFDSLHGRRVCGTFGSAKGVKLNAEKPADSFDWEPLKGFWIISVKRHTDPIAAAIWKAWVDGTPCIYEPPWPEPRSVLMDEQLKIEPESYKQAVFNWSC